MLKKFALEKTPTTHFREVRDSELEDCYDENLARNGISRVEWYLSSRRIWRLKFGVAGISSILEELGRTLTPSPLFSTAVVGVSLIKHANDDVKKEILPKVVSEGLRICFALEESNHHDPLKTSCKAEKKWKDL